MKKIWRGILLVAFMLVAIYGCGTAEGGGNLVVAFFVLVAIAGLMAKAGMIEKPVSKDEYHKYYGEKM